MQEYVIRDYQKGYERGQARIGIEVARKWIWPYAYDQDDLLRIHAQPDFDPDTRHYCFLGEEMVGCMFSLISTSGEQGVSTAVLQFPRMVPGHEQAAQLLMARAFGALKAKGVSRVVGRVTTMCPGDIRLAENTGFAIRDWGYKVYYSYEMECGRLDIPSEAAEEVDLGVDLDACAAIASLWYKRPAEWCVGRIRELYATGIIAHLGVRESGKLVAACLAAPNVLRPSTAAIHYIYAPDERSLLPMLAVAVNKCVEGGTHDLIADLVNEHRGYEPVYQRLGFVKVAEWARCEKTLT